MIKCPNCNKELNENAKFCDNCGNKIGVVDVQIHPESTIVKETIEIEETLLKSEKPKKKKGLIFGVVGVAVIAIVVVASTMLFGGEKVTAKNKQEANYVCYLMDGEIYYADFIEDHAPMKLTTRLINDGEADIEYLHYFGDQIGIYLFVSQDGKYIIFPDKSDTDDEGVNIYYRELDDPESDVHKIDSAVTEYAVNDTSTIVTYLKGDEGTLYQYKVANETKEKIATDVYEFEVSDDGTRIAYINSEWNVYFIDENGEKSKIASDIYDISYVSDDLSVFYYEKDDILYKQAIGEERVKIASGVYDVLKVYETGEIYFVVNESENLPIMNFIDDDTASSDAALEYPDMPYIPHNSDRPFPWEYKTDAEYEAAYAEYERTLDERWEEYYKLSEKFNKDLEEYEKKEARDQLRTQLENETHHLSYFTLYFYDGSEKTVVSDDLLFFQWAPKTADCAPVLIYREYDRSSFRKIKLSEIEDLNNVISMIEDAFYETTECYIAVRDASTQIESDKTDKYFLINETGSMIFYLHNYYINNQVEGNYYGDLYQIHVVDGIVGKPELYDNDVSNVFLRFVGDNILYFKDYSDSNRADMYINKQKIDYDITYWKIEYDENTGRVYYYTDYDDDTLTGTLKMYDGEVAAKIADDVYSFAATPDGHVVYLNDISLKNWSGDLRVWYGGESSKISDDVVSIMLPVKGQYRGYRNPY